MTKESDMDDQRDGGGTNARPLNDTIAGTGPGIPDEALAPGEDGMPEAPSDEEVDRIVEKLGAKDKLRGN